MFLTASLLAVMAGTSLGWHAAGNLDIAAALMALLIIALLHAAANVLNDVYDELSGADRLNTHRIYPYTGGSRFIQNRVLTLGQMRNWGLLLLAVATLLGLGLGAYRGAAVLGLGMAGIGLGVLYSAPPVQLSARGLGELAVAAGFGLLPVCGAAWLQTGRLEWQVLVLSIPVSCWVANILIINEVPDARSDALAGKRTLVVRLGLRITSFLYLGLSLVAVACIWLIVRDGSLSPWVLLLPGLLLPAGLLNGQRIAQANSATATLKPAIERTLAIHAAGCLWIAGSPWF
ncbi:MAG TPA: prenyltransferase, partial [Gammaproteobacteria bacterium]|nr:prenyltransferase [Gammaproteobacteria bacterium]